MHTCDCGWNSDDTTIRPKKCPKCGAKFNGYWVERRYNFSSKDDENE